MIFVKRVAIACGYTGDYASISIKRQYCDVLKSLDLLPILLPCNTIIDLSFVDGILLPGGGDVHPGAFAELTNTPLGIVDRERDRHEIYVAKAAIEQNIPILEICRGMQVLNIAAGGSIVQDLSLAEGYLMHNQSANPEQLWHSVDVIDCKLADIVGVSCFEVNSFHHQAIDRFGDCFSIAALASDGVIEAIVSANSSFIGLQWHPEYLFANHKESRAIWQYYADIIRG